MMLQHHRGEPLLTALITVESYLCGRAMSVRRRLRRWQALRVCCTSQGAKGGTAMIFRLRATHIFMIFSTTVVLTLSGFPSNLSTARVALPTVPGIWCSREPGRTLSTEQRQLLTRSLGRITGWNKIQFSAYGSLVLDEATIQPAAHQSLGRS